MKFPKLNYYPWSFELVPKSNSFNYLDKTLFSNSHGFFYLAQFLYERKFLYGVFSWSNKDLLDQTLRVNKFVFHCIVFSFCVYLFYIINIYFVLGDPFTD